MTRLAGLPFCDGRVTLLGRANKQLGSLSLVTSIKARQSQHARALLSALETGKGVAKHAKVDPLYNFSPYKRGYILTQNLNWSYLGGKIVKKIKLGDSKG